MLFTLTSPTLAYDALSLSIIIEYPGSKLPTTTLVILNERTSETVLLTVLPAVVTRQ